MRKYVTGSLVGVLSAVALGWAMLPLRSHISVSTAALVLVIPAVVGAAIGGFRAGLPSVAAGFLVYDYLYIPPYKTLDVGTTQNWVALAVYVIVMLLVTRVVSGREISRLEAARGGDAARRLSELSELLVGDRPVSDLLDTIVQATSHVFEIPGVSLLVLEEGHLRVAASAGEALTPAELARMDPESGLPVSVGTVPGTPGQLRSVALAASGRPVGILALRGLPTSSTDRAVLNTFANDAALAIERARLREQALRSQLLEEVDRFRQGLLGAVSHDLRTPLATIKVASSTLASRGESLTSDQTRELYLLMEVEADRLTRLVANLLDMTRIEAGVYTVNAVTTSVAQLIDEAVSALSTSLRHRDLVIKVPTSLPLVSVDPTLIGQVLINLLDNANRHSPIGQPIEVSADTDAQRVSVAVVDHGPGIPADKREAIFQRFAQLEKGGRAGLGLTIARTFVEAHGQSIWFEDAPGGGARFVFTLPAAAAESAAT